MDVPGFSVEIFHTSSMILTGFLSLIFKGFEHIFNASLIGFAGIVRIIMRLLQDLCPLWGC